MKTLHSRVYLEIPKKLEMTYVGGSSNENIGKKMEEYFTFSLNKRRTLEISMQTSKGAISYRSSATEK